MTAVQHDYAELGLLVDGTLLRADGRETIAVTNPATGAEIGRLPAATPDDLARALAAAERGFGTWSAVAAWDRGAALKRVADLLRERTEAIARLITLEQGKPLAEARGELARVADIFEWSGEQARHRDGRLLPSRAPGVRQSVVDVPIGPVAAFGPWNFPALSPARKLAELLAAGCSCVLKPAEETPATMLAIAQACFDAGVPPAAVNLVYGDAPTIAATLIGSPVIRKVSFTGSIRVGREIAALAGRHLKPVTLELGGHAPVIVCDDVDAAAIGEAAARAKFRNAGQICISPSRFFVHRRALDPFTEAFTATAFALRVGDGLDPETEMGPLTNERRVRAVTELVDDARASAEATVHVAGGALPAGGTFLAPAVVVTGTDDLRVMREEPFGPVAPIAAFDDLDDALERANALSYGLAGYAFAGAADARRRIADRLRVGMLAINSFEISTPESPFGGVVDSGYGSEGGVEGMAAYLVPKYVNER